MPRLGDGILPHNNRRKADDAYLTHRVQRRARAYEVGRRHYDLGNDLYEAMLDPRMILQLWLLAGRHHARGGPGG